MIGPHLDRAVQIGDRPSDAQNAVVRPRRQTQLVHRCLQERPGVGVDTAEFAHLSRRHTAVESGAIAESLVLGRPRLRHLLAHRGAAVPSAFALSS